MRAALYSLSFTLLGLSAFAADVYVYPTPERISTSDSELPADEAKLLLAQHLGLEQFHSIDHTKLLENADVYSNSMGAFVGKGLENALVLGVGEQEAKDVLPSELSSPLHASVSPSSLLHEYAHQAESLYTEVVVSPSLSGSTPSQKPRRHLDAFTLFDTPESAAFYNDLASLVEYLDKLDNGFVDEEKFGAVDVSRSLHKLSQRVGTDSEQYLMAVAALRASLIKALEQPNLNLVVFTVPPSEMNVHKRSKRQQPPQSPLPPPFPNHPAEPIGAISTCYTSLDSCTNSTSGCSGHGSCVSATKAGKTCFVCACEVTTIETGKGKGTSGKKTIRWAGDKCERKDVSQDFVLLVGTVVGLIILVLGSIGLLVNVGSVELPNVLTGGVVAGIKRE
ncbi:hypothetical protein K474DRAFT_1703422 [Panus rudis PR-1116 ss-1]|nr:hypothetical protein K474DRAFT_1703422 [Panus rudis PR-1116 ss-1]